MQASNSLRIVQASNSLIVNISYISSVPLRSNFFLALSLVAFAHHSNSNWKWVVAAECFLIPALLAFLQKCIDSNASVLRARSKE